MLRLCCQLGASCLREAFVHACIWCGVRTHCCGSAVNVVRPPLHSRGKSRCKVTRKPSASWRPALLSCARKSATSRGGTRSTHRLAPALCPIFRNMRRSRRRLSTSNGSCLGTLVHLHFNHGCKLTLPCVKQPGGSSSPSSLQLCAGHWPPIARQVLRHASNHRDHAYVLVGRPGPQLSLSRPLQTEAFRRRAPPNIHDVAQSCCCSAASRQVYYSAYEQSASHRAHGGRHGRDQPGCATPHEWTS